ncbi:MAG: hypothetical protein HYY12_00340 [Candidatus Methylomirabilis oxyfera]|nr:hypothetical protein [Candidatus Methylomirabilis oxyfera]
MTLFGILILLASRLAAPMWIVYVASAAWYIYEIVSALTIRSATGPPLLFSRESLAGDLFALAGTAYWLLFGVNHHASRLAAIGSLTLAGLHVLLFAVRAYLVPMLWIMQQTAR